MLLGDRSFLDTEQVEAFRKPAPTTCWCWPDCTSASWRPCCFGPDASFVSLTGRTLFTIAALGAYVIAVEDRPPILRAALMAAIYLLPAAALPPDGSAQRRGTRGVSHSAGSAVRTI